MTQVCVHVSSFERRKLKNPSLISDQKIDRVGLSRWLNTARMQVNQKNKAITEFGEISSTGVLGSTIEESAGS